MTAEIEWENIEVSEIVEGLTAVILAPVVLPLAAGIDRPLAKKTLKEAIAFSQRCKQAVAEARERFEDVLAEAEAEVDRELQSELESEPLRASHRYPISETNSEVAAQMLDTMAELNDRVSWLTKGHVDLKLLMPLGLGTLALGQLLTQGAQLEKIPWYNLAWYAFDSFYKLNRGESNQGSSKADAETPQSPNRDW